MTQFRNITPGAVPCNQPIFSNSFGNCQYYNNFPPTQTYKPFPDVIGEGEIASLVLPDGTVQYFFIPTVKWPPPYPSQFNYFSPLGGNNAGVWFVKRITNTASPYNPSSNNYEVPHYATDYNISQSNPNGLQLKFHNDKLTSTSDIHYFYPCLPHYGRISQPPAHAACQCVTTCHYEVPCAKPCCKERTKPMSTTSLHTKQPILKSGSSDILTIHKDKSTDRDKSHKRKAKRKSKRNIVCECPTDVEQSTQTAEYKENVASEPTTSHFGVQESPIMKNKPPHRKSNFLKKVSCINKETKNGANTQNEELQRSCDSRSCCCDKNTVIDDFLGDTVELWFPKTNQSRKDILSESEYNKHLELSSTNTADSSCTCFTDLLNDMDLTE